MRWLLIKDLQILRRSPLVSALLVLYPIVIAILIGFALSRGPEDPKVAFLNEVPQDTPFNLGGTEFDVVGARNELCARIECVRVETREEAEEKVESGEVLGALILPPDLIDKLESLGGLTPEQPIVEVLVNEEDPVKGQLVDDRISALLADANLRISQQVSEVAIGYLDLLLEGGEFSFLGQTLTILGLEETERILNSIRSAVPKQDQKQLDEVIDFSELARENLSFAEPLLGAVSEPIEVQKDVVSGDAPSLDAFAIAVAATVTLMFVTVLLVAGSLALEREENAYPRLTRGLIGPTPLLGEKVLLGIAVSLVVTLVMLAGLELFLSLDWERIWIWIPVIVAGGAAFAAFGAAIGGATREVRASSLLAFMVSLPIAFLSLVSSGTVSAGLYEVIRVVRAAFPFDPALDAMSGALEASGPGLGLPLLHLGILVVAYGVIARLSLRRFASI